MNEQEFGSAPIGKLFVRCTVPAMVGRLDHIQGKINLFKALGGNINGKEG